VIGDATDDVAQVVERVDAVQLAGGEQGVDDAGAFGAFVTAGEEPMCDRPSLRKEDAM
jgi:hypothetical protein